jgi:hypothetical protein
MPRQINQTNADRQRGNTEKPQIFIAQLGQFLCHSANKGRGQRIGQPLHYKYKSNRQKDGAHWRSPFNQFAGATGAACAAGPLPAALLKKRKNSEDGDSTMVVPVSASALL